jgi:hypothetical protein
VGAGSPVAAVVDDRHGLGGRQLTRQLSPLGRGRGAGPLPQQGGGIRNAGLDLIPLTRNEVRHLFVRLTGQPIHTTFAHVLGLSIWRRHRQALAASATTTVRLEISDHNLRLQY